MASLLGEVRRLLGDDAVILETRGPAQTDGLHYELVVAEAAWQETHPSRQTPPGAAGPYVVAIVGPAGAGKTTLAAKLALNPAGFGGRKVGLLTLDTYRAGAVEQLFVFAEIAGLPLEVAYDAEEAVSALKRLGDCDVVIVDTPGRGERDLAQRDWHEALLALRPQEVQLVLPAWMRADTARSLCAAHRKLDPTQLVVTMVDLVEEAEWQGPLALATGLPVRWWSTGPGVPADLRQAGVWTAANASALAWAS
jgi:flagellar biosynthesis protein FlhF